MNTRPAPMPWLALRLAVARLLAEGAMRLEAEAAERDAALVKALARRRCTVRTSRWSSVDRKVWSAHAEIQKSLKALRSDYDRKRRSNKRVEHRGTAIDCPACANAARLLPLALVV